jgi:monoamine oxidase
MNRRLFLGRSVAAAAGVFAVSARASAQVSSPRGRVIIVGGGLSGLVAGYELDRRGYDIRILEAQKRAGGRVHTLRDFGEGLSADCGAARIPADHDLTLRYVREFDLPLIPFYPTDGKFISAWGGRIQEVDWDQFKDATSIVMGLRTPSHWQKIKGGNDLLPKAFADRLAKQISFESPVTRIAQDAGRATVSYKNRSAVETIAADFVICAIPFTMLRKVEFSPVLSSAKADAIRNMSYDSASRVFIETRRRFWSDRGLNGFGFGDDAAEIWNSAFGEPGTHGIMQTYLRGGYSREISRMAENDRVTATVMKLSRLFPETNDNVVQGASKCWSEDPWVEGAWASPDGNQVSVGKTPEGRIFFAGEHLSSHGSWMQGALESGLAVVDQIVSSKTTGVANEGRRAIAI